MAGLIWRGWAALCLLAGAVVLPLFLEVFAGGSVFRFLALPLRYAWAWWLGRPLLRAGWLPPRGVAVGLAAFSTLVSGVVLVDLAGFGSFHPGWFLGLEWWQRPAYPWIELLPRWFLRYRPGYLWTVALWNLLEAWAIGLALWRWRPATALSDPRPSTAPAPASRTS